MRAFQLKITIKKSKPPIWRRVIVPEGITFSQLSTVLNKAMGWSGQEKFEIEFYHQGLKLVEGAKEAAATISGSFDYQEAGEIYIEEDMKENDWFTYTYGKENNWQHRVDIEKVIEDYAYDYPQVVKYKGDCPIEDCSGIEEYYEQAKGCTNTYDVDTVNQALKEHDKNEQTVTEEKKTEKQSVAVNEQKPKADDYFQMLEDMYQEYNSKQQLLRRISTEPVLDNLKKNKVYPNDPCPCGSGKKYKKCCKVIA